MSALAMLAVRADALAAAVTTPATPAPTPSYDPNAITPGITGFVVTALFFVACALLVWSLIRRVSRMTHRERVRAELEAEREQRILDGLEPDQPADGATGATPPDAAGR